MILNAVGVNVSVHDGIDSQSGNGFYTEFFRNVLSVGYNCCQTNIQFFSYFLVYISLGYQNQYFYFPLFLISIKALISFS